MAVAPTSPVHHPSIYGFTSRAPDIRRMRLMHTTLDWALAFRTNSPMNRESATGRNNHCLLSVATQVHVARASTQSNAPPKARVIQTDSIRRQHSAVALQTAQAMSNVPTLGIPIVACTTRHSKRNSNELLASEMNSSLTVARLRRIQHACRT